jgi:hypothetical protein
MNAVELSRLSQSSPRTPAARGRAEERARRAGELRKWAWLRPSPPLYRGEGGFPGAHVDNPRRNNAEEEES